VEILKHATECSRNVLLNSFSILLGSSVMRGISYSYRRKRQLVESSCFNSTASVPVICPLQCSLGRQSRTAHVCSFSAMAQPVSRRPLTAEATIRSRFNPRGIRGGQSGTVEVIFSELFCFPRSVSIHHGSPCSYITCGIDNRLVGCRSSETWPHPIDITIMTIIIISVINIS
jgi:hypothetical protein